MLKIKLFAVAAFVVLTAIVLSSSNRFAASANEDVFREIANYKTWQRINKKPIKVESEFQIDGASGAG